jgi:NifU-like protein involved in Fe-S cluster formation
MGQYSDIVMDHFQSPRNFGVLDEPTVIGIGNFNGCPPTVALHLQIEEGRISKARFQSFTCGATIAAASVLTEMIAGRTISDCLATAEGDLIHALGGLPPGKEHSAKVVLAALRDALRKLPSEGQSDPGREPI